jgi:hypothetical protein
VSTPVEVMNLDLKTCTFEDVKGVKDAPFNFEITEAARVSGER